MNYWSITLAMRNGGAVFSLREHAGKVDEPVWFEAGDDLRAMTQISTYALFLCMREQSRLDGYVRV